MLSCAQHFQSLLDGINIPEKNCTSTWQRDENRDHLSLLKVSSHSRVARILFRYIRLINILNAFDKSDLGDMVCSSLRVYFHLICLYSKAPSLCTCVSPWIRGGHTAGCVLKEHVWSNPASHQYRHNSRRYQEWKLHENWASPTPPMKCFHSVKNHCYGQLPWFLKKKKSQSH